jgi:hypothetical protein
LFLLAPSFFSRIFYLHAAIKNIWRRAGKGTPISTFLWSFPKVSPLLFKETVARNFGFDFYRIREVIQVF